MVTHAIDTGLVTRIRKYVANDINSKIIMSGADKQFEVQQEEIHIISFERVLNNWTALATAEAGVASFYRLVHDGSNNRTIVTIYIQTHLQEAII